MREVEGISILEQALNTIAFETCASSSETESGNRHGSVDPLERGVDAILPHVAIQPNRMKQRRVKVSRCLNPSLSPVATNWPSSYRVLRSGSLSQPLRPSAPINNLPFAARTLRTSASSGFGSDKCSSTLSRLSIDRTEPTASPQVFKVFVVGGHLLLNFRPCTPRNIR